MRCDKALHGWVRPKSISNKNNYHKRLIKVPIFSSGWVSNKDSSHLNGWAEMRWYHIWKTTFLACQIGFAHNQIVVWTPIGILNVVGGKRYPYLSNSTEINLNPGRELGVIAEFTEICEVQITAKLENLFTVRGGCCRKFIIVSIRYCYDDWIWGKHRKSKEWDFSVTHDLIFKAVASNNATVISTPLYFGNETNFQTCVTSSNCGREQAERMSGLLLNEIVYGLQPGWFKAVGTGPTGNLSNQAPNHIK